MIDSSRYNLLREKYEAEIEERVKIDILSEIGSEVRNFDVEEASKIAEDIIQRSKVLAYTQGVANGYKLSGACHWLRGEYDTGIEVLNVGLNLAKRIKNRQIEGRILYYLGNIYRDKGDFANVITYFTNALAIYESIGDEVAQAIIMASISNVMYDLEDFDTALEYALKCLPKFQHVKNKINHLNLCNTLGNIYFKKEQFEEAMLYFKTNLDNTEVDTLAHVTAESGVGKVYYKMKDFEEARKYLSNALRQAEHLGNVEVQIICHFYLGRMYMDKGTYRQAFQYLNHAFSLASEYDRKHDLMSIHEMLSEIYDRTTDVPKAYYHIKAHQQLKDEIFQQKILNELRNLQVKQQVELAQKEKDVAERTAYLKQQFMANMSHEIRTPMNAIVGMTKLLINREHLQPQERYLKAIEMSANNLLVIINDILDLSKIEAGKIEIEHVDFTLSDVLQSVEDMLLLKAEEKDIQLKLNTDPRLPNRLIGDPTRLSQILINLAGNAVKFTSKGYVEIKTLLQSKNSKLWVQFDVVDTGIGISTDYIDHIFDSFTQAGTDVTRKFGGTGLGLTISKQITNLMGGEISVKSTLGKGTTFSILVPFEEATIQEASKEKNAVTPEMIDLLNHAYVLLAEDNEFNQIVAIETLRDQVPNIAIDTAVNGQAALNMCKIRNYDIVLMDVQMPVMDGVEATQKIRNELPAPAKDVRIIAMTANVLQEDVQKYADIGMNSYISKPFDVNELLLKMYSVLDTGIKKQAESGKIETETKSAPLTDEKPKGLSNGAFASETASQHPQPLHPQRIFPNKFPNKVQGAQHSQHHHRAAEAVIEKSMEYLAQSTKILPKVEEKTVVPVAPKPSVVIRSLSERVTDRNFLMKFTGGNTEKMRRYIGMFMDNAPQLLAKLRQALDDHDFPAVKIAAHSLKPQMSYMGIQEEVSHIQKIEQMAVNEPIYEEIKNELVDLNRVCLKAFEELKTLLQ